MLAPTLKTTTADLFWCFLFTPYFSWKFPNWEIYYLNGFVFVRNICLRTNTSLFTCSLKIKYFISYDFSQLSAMQIITWPYVYSLCCRDEQERRIPYRSKKTSALSTLVFQFLAVKSCTHFVYFTISQFNSLHCKINFTKKIFIPYPWRTFQVLLTTLSKSAIFVYICHSWLKKATAFTCTVFSIPSFLSLQCIAPARSQKPYCSLSALPWWNTHE